MSSCMFCTIHSARLGAGRAHFGLSNYSQQPWFGPGLRTMLFVQCQRNEVRSTISLWWFLMHGVSSQLYRWQREEKASLLEPRSSIT